MKSGEGPLTSACSPVLVRPGPVRPGQGTGQGPTALSRVLLLPVSSLKVPFPVSSAVSAVRRLMRDPLGGWTNKRRVEE